MRVGHETTYASKGQTISKANYSFLNSPKKRTELTILSKEHAQDSVATPLYFFQNLGGAIAPPALKFRRPRRVL